MRLACILCAAVLCVCGCVPGGSRGQAGPGQTVGQAGSSFSGKPLALKYSDKTGPVPAVDSGGRPVPQGLPADALLTAGQVAAVKEPLRSSTSMLGSAQALITLEVPVTVGGRSYGEVWLTYEQYSLPGGPIHAGDKVLLAFDAQGRLIEVYPANSKK